MAPRAKTEAPFFPLMLDLNGRKCLVVGAGKVAAGKMKIALPPDLVDRLRSVRHYDGQPIPADAITEPLSEAEAVPA